ncbi:MAG: hypothetical protein KAJ49_04565 [Arcobacteraceae bacterium]|nr:hypothetical protein [Arcobacteraceae bacterium]
MELNKRIEEQLENQFPKGDKARGRALVLHSIAQIEFNDLQEAYNIAMEEINRLRKGNKNNDLFKEICGELAIYKFGDKKLTAEQVAKKILELVKLTEYAYFCKECCTMLEIPCFINGECPECKSKSKEILYMKIKHSPQKKP